LFATTIRENIEYGNPGATQEQIESAARMANAHDFICGFPEGYDTNVGDKGENCEGTLHFPEDEGFSFFTSNWFDVMCRVTIVRRTEATVGDTCCFVVGTAVAASKY
jgi:hypothetical protein